MYIDRTAQKHLTMQTMNKYFYAELIKDIHF
jgi:hypothetical protein